MGYVARQFRMGKPDLHEGVKTRRHGDDDEDPDMGKKNWGNKRKEKRKVKI